MRTTCGRLPPGATHCCVLILQQEYLETKPWKLINCENVFLAEKYDWRTQKQFAFFVAELCLKWKTLNALVLSLNQHLMNRHPKLVHQYGQQHQHQCQHNHHMCPQSVIMMSTNDKKERWTNLLRCVSSNSRIVSPNSSTSVIGTTGSSPIGDQLCTNDFNCIDVC